MAVAPSESGPSLAVVGLGPMGSAIARALVPLDPDLTVWNRSAARIGPLVADGMTPAGSVEEAIGAADVTFLCVRDYGVSRELLERCDPGLLADRTLVQLSTETPAEARELEGWSRERQLACLDGTILCYPHEVGTKDSVVLYAGAADLFARLESVLCAIGPDPVFCGTSVGAAAAQSLGAMLVLYGASFGFLQGAAIAAAEGTPIEAFARVCDRAAAMVPGLLRGLAGDLEATTAQEVAAVSASDALTLGQISATSTGAGVSSRLSDAMLDLMQDAVVRDGEGESMVVAYDVIRSPRRLGRSAASAPPSSGPASPWR